MFLRSSTVMVKELASWAVWEGRKVEVEQLEEDYINVRVQGISIKVKSFSGREGERESVS